MRLMKRFKDGYKKLVAISFITMLAIVFVFPFGVQAKTIEVPSAETQVETQEEIGDAPIETLPLDNSDESYAQVGCRIRLSYHFEEPIEGKDIQIEFVNAETGAIYTDMIYNQMYLTNSNYQKDKFIILEYVIPAGQYYLSATCVSKPMGFCTYFDAATLDEETMEYTITDGMDLYAFGTSTEEWAKISDKQAYLQKYFDTVYGNAWEEVEEAPSDTEIDFTPSTEEVTPVDEAAVEKNTTEESIGSKATDIIGLVLAVLLVGFVIVRTIIMKKRG